MCFSHFLAVLCIFLQISWVSGHSSPLSVLFEVFTYAPLEEGLTAPLCDYLQLLTPEERIFFFGDLHGSELVVSSNHAMRSCMKWCPQTQ